MSTGSERNPLHSVIDLVILHKEAFLRIHQSNTNEARENALKEWYLCHPIVWGNSSSRNDAIRRHVDPAKAWLSRTDSRFIRMKDLDFIEQCGHTLSAFAISASPMAMPNVYSKMYTTEDELWKQWQEQGNEIMALHDMIFRLQEVTARAGELWTPASDVQCNLATTNDATQPPPKPDVVLVTVNVHETQAVLKAFRETTGVETVPVSLDGRVYHNLGTLNGTTVFHAMSEMGSGGPGRMQQTVDKAIRSLGPGAVIAVGIAFGMNEGNQDIGDILVRVSQISAHSVANGSLAATVG